METALATRPVALKGKILKPLERALSIAVNAYREHKGKALEIQKELAQAARSDFEVLKSLCGSDLDALINRKARQVTENVIRNRGTVDTAGHPKSAEGQNGRAEWSWRDVPDLGGGQVPGANNGRSVPAAAKNFPGHAKRGASSIASVQNTMSNSLLDSFKIRDGRKIGDILFRELESLRAENAVEAELLRQIQRHAVNVPIDALVRDIVSDDQLATMLDRAKVKADV